MVRQKQDIAVLTHFWFDVFLQWSPAERNSFSLTVKWGWTASYHTIALNSVLSDGLIKTQYLLGIFVMTFTDVLHCSGRLVISIKTYIEQLESIYQQVSESLNYFFVCCTKRQWVQCLHTCCHSLERQDETSFFFCSSPCALGILGLITNFKPPLVQESRRLYTQNKSLLLTCICN